VKNLEGQGEFVAPKTRPSISCAPSSRNPPPAALASANYSRSMMHTNDAFFIEQMQNINVIATDEQLVDFLYKLGSGASMIRVRDLELQPDNRAPAPQRQHPARRQLPKIRAGQFEIHNRNRQMKTTTLVLILFLTGLELWAQTPPSPNPSPLQRRRPARLNGATNNAAVTPPDRQTSAIASPVGRPGARSRRAGRRGTRPLLRWQSRAHPLPRMPASRRKRKFRLTATILRAWT
jgi:hypothetical protein